MVQTGEGKHGTAVNMGEQLVSRSHSTTVGSRFKGFYQ